MPGFKPGSHWWEASALTTAASLAPRSNGRKLVGKQSFEPTTPNISFFCDRRSVARSVAWSSKSYGLYPSHDAVQVLTLLGVVASVCTPLQTRRLKTPNIVDSVRLNIVLADNTDRVREKFCMVKVVFVLVLYSPLDASGP